RPVQARLPGGVNGKGSPISPHPELVEGRGRGTTPGHDLVVRQAHHEVYWAAAAGREQRPMKITGIKAWQVDLPLKEGRYSWSNGNFVEVFDSTVVAVETDAGITGYAECCPLGSAYLPAYALGVRSGLQEIGPKLIGLDPTDLDVLNRHMDAVLRGHAYVKAPIDIACWDILGKLTGLPIYKLLGGAAQEKVALYRAISQQPATEMAENVAGYRAEGYTKFQLKVGGNADDDIARIRAAREILQPSDILVADANTG